MSKKRTRSPVPDRRWSSSPRRGTPPRRSRDGQSRTSGRTKGLNPWLVVWGARPRHAGTGSLSSAGINSMGLADETSLPASVVVGLSLQFGQLSISGRA